MKVGDPGNCIECGRGIVLKGSRHKYCVDCAVWALKKRQKAKCTRYRIKYREHVNLRHQEWVLKNPDKYKANSYKYEEKRKRLLQLGKSMVQLVPSLEKLL